MDFELRALSLKEAAGHKCDALVVLVDSADWLPADPISTLIMQARQSGDLETKAGGCLLLYRTPGIAAIRLVLVSVGDGEARQIERGIGAAIQSMKSARLKRVTVVFAGPAESTAVQAAVCASADASYIYVATRTKASKVQPRSIEKLVIGVTEPDALRDSFERAVATSRGVEMAKEWANRPGNHCTPTLLAEAAKTLGKLKHVSVEVLGPKEVKKLGMGAFMAVAQGSEEPLRFIVLRYEGTGKHRAPTVLVGKGITFDTGGVSLKPAAEMDEMKYDMCGAASVLGVFRALGEYRPEINVVGIVPSCENMNDGKAIKPGDVVTSMSGQTIEVLNTDAEGRLILCDALTYAERFEPTAVIDIATLTGACVIALGGVRSGLFTPDDALARELSAAGDAAQDLCWRMPLDDAYADGLKSHFADIPNIAGRPAGAITAAKFLQRFAGSYPWAHLDIAGTAWKSGQAKGATGRPVGLLFQYLLDKAGAGMASLREGDEEQLQSPADGPKPRTRRKQPKT